MKYYKKMNNKTYKMKKKLNILKEQIDKHKEQVLLNFVNFYHHLF